MSVHVPVRWMVFVSAVRRHSPPGCEAARAAQAPAAPTARQAGLVRDFKKAWEAGDIGALIGLLDPGATAIADGGGLVTAELRPIEGGEQIARYLVDLTGRAPSNKPSWSARSTASPAWSPSKTASP